MQQLSLFHRISQTWACNEFLAYSTLHVEILNLISLCQENRVFGFTAPSPLLGSALVNPWPATRLGIFPVSPERDACQKCLERISSSLYHSQRILHVRQINRGGVEKVLYPCSYTYHCKPSLAMIVDLSVLPGLCFQSLLTFHCRFHCRTLSNFGLSGSKCRP